MLTFLGGNGGGGSIFRTASFPNHPSLMIILSSFYCILFPAKTFPDWLEIFLNRGLTRIACLYV